MHRRHLSLLTAAWIMGGCGQHPVPPPESAQTSTAVAWSDNGWSAQERAEYYHLAEGSELMPYQLLVNVVSTKTGKPFLEDIERFGFIPDATSSSNPHGLPVGLTTGHSRNQGHVGLEEVGFNCAACHVAELTYKGRKLVVDGAPSHVDLQAYQEEFKESFETAMGDPAKLYRLVVAFNRGVLNNNEDPPAAASSYSSNAAASNVAPAPIADKAFHSTSSHNADAADARSVLSGQNALQCFATTVAILKAQLAYVKNGKLLLDGTVPGPGRIDAFGAARNLLFPKDAMRMQSPVSFPFIWNVPDTAQQRSESDFVWIHYDGDTNSILERNIGQALGMGAVFDPKTFESTLRIQNLHTLEVLTHKLKSPKWPADLFGPIDSAKARTGEKIFNDTCRDCHQNRLFTLLEVGTDPQRANSFGQPVASAGHVTFPAAVQPILDKLKARAFLDDEISPADQATMDAPKVIWRATGKYLARPLAGVWATAPYLHNGSVPNLRSLLYPEKRPKSFVAGSREYDPKDLGYSTDGSGWRFDTTQPGNSNIGHSGPRFGTNLTDEQKDALLEYLKSI